MNVTCNQEVINMIETKLQCTACLVTIHHKRELWHSLQEPVNVKYNPQLSLPQKIQ